MKDVFCTSGTSPTQSNDKKEPIHEKNESQPEVKNELEPLKVEETKTKLVPLWDQLKDEKLQCGKPAWMLGPVWGFRVVDKQNYQEELAKEKGEKETSPEPPAPEPKMTELTPLEQAMVDWSAMAAKENEWRLAVERRAVEEVVKQIDDWRAAKSETEHLQFKEA